MKAAQFRKVFSISHYKRNDREERKCDMNKQQMKKIIMEMDCKKIYPFVLCIVFMIVFWALVLTLIFFAFSVNDRRNRNEFHNVTENEESKRYGKILNEDSSLYTGRGNRQRGKHMWTNASDNTSQSVDYIGVFWWQTKEIIVRAEPEEIHPTLKIVMTCLLSLMLLVNVSGNALTLLALSYVRS